jgi:ribosomal protein S18 acetylase RimI-like enzyme
MTGREIGASDARIRLARPDDWERVRDIRLRSLTDTPDAFGATFEEESAYGQPDWMAWIEGWEGATNTMYVAEAGGALVGMAVGSREGSATDAHLYAMWVDPAWRTRGVGSRLVDEVLAWARSWGSRWVILGVTENNDRAARFYERLAFADTGERHQLREGSPLEVRILRREP